MIPPALAAVHNFIRIHDPDEIENFPLEVDMRASVNNTGLLKENLVS